RLMHPFHTALDPCAGLFPDDERTAERLGQGGKGAVVRRRSEAAAAEDVGELWVRKLAPDLLDDLGRPITNACDALQRVAEQSQSLGEPVRVGVEGEPADELIADRND